MQFPWPDTAIWSEQARKIIRTEPTVLWRRFKEVHGSKVTMVGCGRLLPVESMWNMLTLLGITREADISSKARGTAQNEVFAGCGLEGSLELVGTELATTADMPTGGF